MEKNEQQDPDYHHGYSSGMDRANPEIYEGYLSSVVSYDRLRHLITDYREELKDADQDFRQTREEQLQTYGALQQHVGKLDAIRKEVGRQDRQVQETEAEIEELEDRYRKAAPKYSLFAGLLYFVAGLSFVAGDLIISHEIVAYALNIRNTTEAWFFAVGLAMVSILLKPVYDRLIEGPYLQNQESSRKLYAVFKLTLAVFSILTLFILGWFRYEAYRTDKLKQAITQNVKNLQLQQSDPNSSAAIQQVEKQLQQVDVLNQGLVTSPFALASFVLSGVLFAVAGAVCLGISFPVLQGFWFRWLQAGPQLKRLKKLRAGQLQALSETEQGMTEHQIRKETLENKLETLTPLADLDQRRKDLREIIRKLEEECKVAEINRRIAAFNDGFSKGEHARSQMDEDEWKQSRNGIKTNGHHSEPKVNGESH